MTWNCHLDVTRSFDRNQGNECIHLLLVYHTGKNYSIIRVWCFVVIIGMHAGILGIATIGLLVSFVLYKAFVSIITIDGLEWNSTRCQIDSLLVLPVPQMAGSQKSHKSFLISNWRLITSIVYLRIYFPGRHPPLNSAPYFVI